MRRRAARGFTLIEIMIVVAVVAILTAVAIPNLTAYRKISHAKACKANMNLIRGACAATLIRKGVVETDLDALSDNSSGAAFLKGKPQCPIGGTYAVSYDDAAQSFVVTCSLSDENEHDVNATAAE